MANFSQENSPLRLFTPLPENTLLPIRLVGREKLGDSFEFTIDMLGPRGVTVPFQELVGQCARLTAILPGGLVRHFHGEIWSVTLADPDSVFDHYTMVLKPRLAKLGLIRRSRIFQDKSALEILGVLTAAAGSPAISRLLRPQPTRLNCTQYRETDLEFFHRLCSESGITHYWVHTENDHQLVLTDSTSESHQQLGDLAYDTRVGITADATCVRSWQLTQERCPTAAGLSDSHFQLFNQKLEAVSNAPLVIRAGQMDIRPKESMAPWQEDGQSSARFFDAILSSGGDKDGALAEVYPSQEGRARILATGAAAGSVRAALIGDCCQLAPGHSFHLTGHPSQNGPWLVVEADHNLRLDGQYWAGEPTPLQLETRALSAPLTLDQATWPPVPRPKVGGVQTAIVIGSDIEEPVLDKFGRVQVRFWWDRDDNTHSCWLRVAQVWAGNHWGASFWPRVGNEVVVAFEDGDPDRPLVVGCLYNAKNMPPYPLPQNRYIAGWKSLTEEGDPASNFHQILMSDEKGQEIVHIHAESSVMIHQEDNEFRMKPSLNVSFQG
jgi:type VI secretion system secreted protein VgrG